MLTDELRDLLEQKVFGHVATIGPDGEPHNSPVWVGTDGEHLLFSLTTGRQKYRNLSADPRVAVSLTDPADPYSYREFRGRAVAMDADEDNAFIDSMAKKYVGEDEYPWHRPGDHRVVVRVAVEHTTGMG